MRCLGEYNSAPPDVAGLTWRVRAQLLPLPPLPLLLISSELQHGVATVCGKWSLSRDNYGNERQDV